MVAEVEEVGVSMIDGVVVMGVGWGMGVWLKALKARKMTPTATIMEMAVMVSFFPSITDCYLNSNSSVCKEGF